jgi:hypothetical protein
VSGSAVRREGVALATVAARIEVKESHQSGLAEQAAVSGADGGNSEEAATRHEGMRWRRLRGTRWGDYRHNKDHITGRIRWQINLHRRLDENY